jgi:hypothetical protein
VTITNRFIEKKKLDASVHNAKSLKYYIYLQAQGVRGIYGTDASVETVRNYWNLFIGVWRRKYRLIVSDLVEAVTNVSPRPC